MKNLKIQVLSDIAEDVNRENLEEYKPTEWKRQREERVIVKGGR